MISDEQILELKEYLEVKEERKLNISKEDFEEIILELNSELQQYRAIGTVEECREARERQIVKKPTLYGDFEDGKLLCPNCEEDLMDLAECGFNCCPYCGQTIDWSE